MKAQSDSIIIRSQRVSENSSHLVAADVRRLKSRGLRGRQTLLTSAATIFQTRSQPALLWFGASHRLACRHVVICLLTLLALPLAGRCDESDTRKDAQGTNDLSAAEQHK